MHTTKGLSRSTIKKEPPRYKYTPSSSIRPAEGTSTGMVLSPVGPGYSLVGPTENELSSCRKKRGR